MKRWQKVVGFSLLALAVLVAAFAFASREERFSDGIVFLRGVRVDRKQSVRRMEMLLPVSPTSTAPYRQDFLDLREIFYPEAPYAEVARHAREEFGKKAVRVATSSKADTYSIFDSKRPGESVWISVFKTDSGQALIEIQQSHSVTWLDRARLWLQGLFK